MQNTYHEGTYYLCEVHDGMKRVHNLVNFGAMPLYCKMIVFLDKFLDLWVVSFIRQVTLCANYTFLFITALYS